MKTSKHTIKIKTRITSIVACLALFLCAVLSFGFTGITRSPKADGEEENTLPDYATSAGIRFVQVAAGADFAIGLTYDGDIYGWSLESGRTTNNTNATSLGGYYTSTPTKIDFDYLVGPGQSGTNNWTGNGSVEYHTTYDEYNAKAGNTNKLEKPIVKAIAATRTTAALITTNGYIYTWGKDDVDAYVTDMNTYPNYLLLRETTDSINWYTPYIINYGYGGSTENSAAKFFTPFYQDQANGISGDVTLNQIEAAEYNYIISFQRGNYNYTYVWGSRMYSVPNTQIASSSYDYVSTSGSGTGNSSEMTGGYDTMYVYRTANVGSIVAGGYNVGMNSGVLRLRGRNFLTSQSVSDDGTSITVTNAVKTNASSNIAFGNYTVQNAIIGGKGEGVFSNGIILGPASGTGGSNTEFDDVGNNSDSYYGKQETSITYKTNGEASIVNAQGANIESAGTLKTTLYGVSLGNDVGYGISSGGVLHVWGDNSVGQWSKNVTSSGDDPVTEISALGSNVVSVAAGKQLSGSIKAFNNTNTYTNGAFSNDTKNGADFITGAVTSEGYLYVWSNNNTTPVRVNYAGENTVTATGDTATFTDADKIIAVYSGYGNNLFAITAAGKLMRIQSVRGTDSESGVYQNDGTYIKTRYDDFGGVTNWTVNNGNTNITFTAKSNPTVGYNEVSAKNEVTPATFDTATFYVWNATIGTEALAFAPLVASNAIGDEYRILGWNDENEKTFLNSKLSDAPSGENAYAPTFKFGNTEMTPMQSANMFTARVVYDANNGVGIEVTPIRSSRGQKITVEFYIARYNSRVNFTNTTDTALYYDLQKCSIQFTIADTPTVTVFEPFDARNGGKSNVPLLDPNNVDNKYYSIALQDVSSGVNALVNYLTSSITENQADVRTDLSGKILTAMVAQDAGYPAASKITSGNLDYYLGSDAQRFYNDSYQYLFYDGDGDRLITPGQAGDVTLMSRNSGSSDSVGGSRRSITVTIDVPESVPTTDRILTDFDNIYGLYNITFNNGRMSFTYDVLQFEGKTATGNLAYTEENNSVSVSSYQTTDSGMYLSAMLQVAAYPVSYLREQNNSSYMPTTNSGAGVIFGENNASTTLSNLLALFSQPSVRLNVKNGENYVYGSANALDGANTYTVNYTDAVYVGLGTTVNLSDYVSVLSDRIQFSYNNSISEYNVFNAQFVDETAIGESRKTIVELDGRKIVIKPTTAQSINFTVAVQRFSNSNNQRTFSATNNASGSAVTEYNEKVYINFIFSNIRDFEFSATTAGAEFTITKTETIDVFGGASALNNAYATINTANADALKQLTASVDIVGLKSSEDSKQTGKLFDVSKTSNTSFTVTPIASGTGIVQFIATVYGKSLFFSITFNISSVTTLTDTIIVVDDQYMYVADIKNKLDQANSFNTDIDNYRILMDDIQNPDSTSDIEKVYNAFYFTNSKGQEDKPVFVKNVVLEGKTTDNPSIRIVSANTAVQSSETYYLHIKFVRGNFTTYVDAEAEKGNILEAVIPVESGKSVITAYSVNINCKHPTDNEFVTYNETSGVNTVATVDISFLLTSINVESAPNYDVFLVSAGTTTSTYFNYAPDASKKKVVISPLYNTPEPCEVSVSVSNGSRYLVISFNVSVEGILTTLPVTKAKGDGETIGYGDIWLYSFIIVFGVLAIIFIIRLIVYFRRRAKQRALIKRNQELIRMRDRMHNKANAASKEQIVKTKLKMEDPKYAKVFNDMRKSKEEESGILLENSDLAATADSKVKKNKKKKKGGKKSVAELKAELEAKKAAFAAAQQNAQPVNPFDADVPLEDVGFVPPEGGFADGGFADGGFADGNFGAQDVDGNEIVFDASDLGDGM